MARVTEDSGSGTKKTLPVKTDPLAELQASIAAGKALAQKKNIEIPTIALEMAVNSGDISAVQSAATDLGKAQGLTGNALRTFAYNTAQTAAKGEKPEAPPADSQYKYDYVWRQDVGGPGGKWVLVKSPIFGTSSGDFSSGGNFRFPGSTGGGPTGPGSTGPTGPTTTYRAPDGRVFTDLNAYNAYIEQTAAEAKRRAGQSAWDILSGEFARFGMAGLLEDVKNFITEGLSRDELLLKLRATPAYEKRFAANAQRVKAGLRALSEAEYIALEDQYQNVMRNYGLPASYYTRGDMGVQPGFEKFIAGDVSAAELEDRIQTAQNRVINAAPEVSRTLKQFYPDITDGDILAYALDPNQALTNIKRKIGAAEIGAGAAMAGLTTGLTRAEELQRYGVTGEAARAGYQTIGSLLPRATQLGDIYAKMGMGPYTQTTAEAEVFGTPGAVEAAAKRRKLTELEQAQFGGSAGATSGALARERAGQF